MQTFNANRQVDKKPIEFEVTIPGATDSDESRIEKFHINGYLPIWKLLELDAAVGRNELARRYIDFFENAIVKGELPRWRRLVREPKNGIDAQVLSNIYHWAYGVYAALPTQSAESSSTGQDEPMTSTAG